MLFVTLFNALILKKLVSFVERPSATKQKETNKNEKVASVKTTYHLTSNCHQLNLHLVYPPSYLNQVDNHQKYAQDRW
jgi:hypothetical protein